MHANINTLMLTTIIGTAGNRSKYTNNENNEDDEQENDPGSKS